MDAEPTIIDTGAERANVEIPDGAELLDDEHSEIGEDEPF
jgi:hypothetical protein